MTSSIETLGFEGIGAYLEAHAAQATEDLANYYGPFEPKAGGHTPRGFTGRFFDRLTRTGEPNVFGPADIAAVATLSVPLDGHQVAALLALGPQLTSLLAAAPGPGVSLWEVDADELTDEAPLGMAYSMLKTIDGIGPVRASKLMAAKRPDLVPIRTSWYQSSSVPAPCGGLRGETWSVSQQSVGRSWRSPPPRSRTRSASSGDSTSSCGWRRRDG